MIEKDLETYFKLMEANGIALIYKTAKELNLFSMFPANTGISLEDFADKNNFQKIPLKVLFDNLITMGLLKKESDLYFLTDATKFFQGNYSNLSSEYWAHLPELLKSGTPYKRMDVVSDSEKEYQVQVKSLEWMMTPSAKFMVENIGDKRSLEILDVGAGSGVWSFHFVYQNKNNHVTLADWPAVLKVAKETAKNKNIESNVSYIEGNFHETQFPNSKYDYAILGNVTHILSPDQNKFIFKKISESLKDDGRLIILDAYGENKNGNFARSLYQMGLTIRTVQGKVYYPDELTPWLKEVGFKNFEFDSINVVPYSMGMFIAGK